MLKFFDHPVGSPLVRLTLWNQENQYTGPARLKPAAHDPPPFPVEKFAFAACLNAALVLGPYRDLAGNLQERVYSVRVRLRRMHLGQHLAFHVDQYRPVETPL